MQVQLVVERRVGEVHEVLDVVVGRLPRQATEHADVVEEEQVVLLEPRTKRRRVEVAAGDAPDRWVTKLFFEQRRTQRGQVVGKRHTLIVLHRRARLAW